MEYRIGYVILHYQSIDLTRNCIASILPLLAGDDLIIVVDNASPNGSGEKLRQEYSNDTRVSIITAPSNLGFAKGNNLGIAAARDAGCNLIAVSNNDILIEQENFRACLTEAVETAGPESLGVLGPKLKDANNRVYETNPTSPTYLSPERCRKGMRRNRIRYALSYVGLDEVIDRIYFKGKTAADAGDTPIWERRLEDVRLHGCFFVLAPAYIERLGKLVDGTFLFLEEDILYVQVTKAGLKMVYDPSFEVKHLGDGTIGAQLKHRAGRMRRFKYRHQADSFRVLEEVLSG